VAELVPPVLANNFGLVDFVNGPEVAVAGFVEEDCLENVAVKVHVGRELGLVVCAVETPGVGFCEWLVFCGTGFGVEIARG